MSDSGMLVNRVANSGLVTINLEEFYPIEDFVALDLKQFLFRELILKELDFRKALQEMDWTPYDGKVICVWCSNDAIIPTWAYMLVAKHADGHASRIFYGNVDWALIQHYELSLRGMDWSSYKDAKVVIKGCSDKPVPASAYQTLCSLLLPYCGSIMFGEPCSTVPVFKRKAGSETQGA